MKRPIYIDASCLKGESNCDRRMLLHILRGWTRGGRAANFKAGYGTAFHVFLENYYSVKPADRAGKLEEFTTLCLDAYKKYEPHITQNAKGTEFRFPEHLRGLCSYYHQRYKFGDAIIPTPLNKDDGRHLLESKFCIPWIEGDTYIIYLTGTIDMVAEYGNRLCIVDHKTTSTFNVDQFFAEFAMNIQTQFYVWIFRRLSEMKEYLPIVVNGIFIKKTTLEAAKRGEWDGARLQRSHIIEYSPAQMQQFETYLLGRLAWIEGLLKTIPPEDMGNPNYAACHGRFQSCQFYDLCSLPPAEQHTYLHGRFINEPYEPLHFND